MRARVWSWLTSMASGTSPTRATNGPTVTFRVAAATAPSSGKQEMAGRAGSPMGNRWSYTKTPSSPASSARRAVSSAVSASNRKLGSTNPTRIMSPTPRTVNESGGHSPRFHSQFAEGLGEEGGADGSGAVAEGGRDDADLGPVFGPLD